jgi:acyl carrier protein
VQIESQAFTTWLRELLAGILGLPVAQIRDDVSLDALGIDSLTAVSLTDEVQRHLGRPVEASLFLDHPTIRAAAAHLLGA